MKAPAVVFVEPKRMEIREMELPEPGPQQIGIRTVFSGISQGTERWLLTGRYNHAGDDVAAGLSLLVSPKYLHAENRFAWGPIVEVAVLFVGIFVTMVPALALLRDHGAKVGVTEPWQFFWLTGGLSAFLDNAPTYVTFATLAAEGDDFSVLVANLLSYDACHDAMVERVNSAFGGRVCEFPGIAGNNHLLFAVRTHTCAGTGASGGAPREGFARRRGLRLPFLNRLLARALVAWLAWRPV